MSGLRIICYSTHMLMTACIAWTIALAGWIFPAPQPIPIASIVFTGNAALDSNQLKGQLRVSREGGWYNPGTLSAELSNLERYCQDQGYLHAKVGPPVVEFQEIPDKGKGVAIRVPVSEGPAYKFGNASIRNVTAFNESVLLQMCPLHPGQGYSRAKMRVWKDKVEDGYQTMGYIRFDAEMIENIDESKRAVDVVMECKEGNPYQVAKITILGVSAEEQSKFKKHLLLGEGGLYNPELIGMSLYFINQMGTYKPLYIPDVDVRIDDAKNTVDLTFKLEPKKKPSSDGGWKQPVVPFAGLRFAEGQDSQTTIKTEVALVNVVFSVADHANRAVAGLKASDFIVLEDKRPQKIEYFSTLDRSTPVPLTIALLIDTSGSVKNKLDFEKSTAAEFFRSVLRKSKDLGLIIQFDSEVNLVQDYTDDNDRLIRALDSLQAGNSTALYDAIYLAVEEKLKTETGRRVVVVITDGEDTSSKLRKEAAIESAQKSDVLIYGIGVRGEFGTNFGVLKKFSEETGGLFFSPRARLSDIQEAFRAIDEDLQAQYSLAYSSTNPKRDGTFRTIEIRPKIGGIRVRARKGYYAPKGAQAVSN